MPVLLTILKASGQLKADLDDSVTIGEVALDGMLRPVNGVLALAITAAQNGIKNIFVPSKNAAEAAIVEGINVYPADNIKQIISHLNGETIIEKQPVTEIREISKTKVPDFKDVKGQLAAKKAMEIAAAGGHNIILVALPEQVRVCLQKDFPVYSPK